MSAAAASWSQSFEVMISFLVLKKTMRGNLVLADR